MKSKFIPGLRIIKTVLSVFLCLIIFYLFDYYKPVYALLACVLMMKSTPEDSVQAGKERMIGTLLGGLVAEIFIGILHFNHIAVGSWWYVILIPLAVFAALMTSKIFALPSYTASMSCVLILIMMLSYSDTLSDSVFYVGMRMIETMVGIVISVVVNLYFKIPHAWIERIKR